MNFNLVNGNTFLKWRREMLVKGGRKVDLDWLLHIKAGVSWGMLQNIILNPENFFPLDISTEELEVIWKNHLRNHTPLQYLISKCPW